MNASLSAKLTFAFIGLLFASVVFYLQPTLNSLGIANVVFVDGSTYIKIIAELISGERVLLEHKASWLVFFLYYAPVLMLGAIGAMILNYILLVCYFQHSFIGKTNNIFLALFLPFFLVSAYLPNKEILVLVATLLFTVCISNKKYFAALLVGAICFLVRDGHGVLLVLTAAILMVSLPLRFTLLVTLLAATALDFFLQEIADLTKIFALQRTIWILEAREIAFSIYPLRLFGTLTNLGARVPVFDFKVLSITSLTLFLSGIGIFMAFLSSISVVLFRWRVVDDVTRKISFFYIFTAIFISVSPLIQPRYLIPVALIYLTYTSNSLKNKQKLLNLLVVSTVFVLSLRFIYFITIGLPDMPAGIDLDDSGIYYKGKLF